MTDKEKPIEAVPKVDKNVNVVPPAQAAAPEAPKADEAGKDDKIKAAGGINKNDTLALSTDAQDELKKEEEAKKAQKEAENAEKDGLTKEQREQELQKKIEELQKQIDEDLKSGNMDAYANHLRELQGVQTELDVLRGIQSADNTPKVQQASQANQPELSFMDPSRLIQPISGGPGGAAPGGAPGGDVGEAENVTGPPINLQGNDRKEADFINSYLASQGSPAAKYDAGAMFVKYGKENNVDPLALVAIAGHETGFGKLGVGMRKMLGVGAYDSNPNGVTPYDGLENQIKYGAKTFANLRAKGGSSANDSTGNQLAAVNRAGWATDKNWHRGVANQYNRIADAGKKYG